MTMRLGLERIIKVLDQLGRPQEEMTCLHVGGTNGKGSVTAFLAHILVANGYRTGWYTSPHLERWEERIRVDGVAITAEQRQRLSGEVQRAQEQAEMEPLTEFERETAIAILHFARQGVQVAVMEVGLGGRLDATNVWAKPLVSVVTNVALDHTDRLGNELSQIAWEKAGIIKEGVPVVTGAQGEGLEVLTEVAQSRHAPLERADRTLWQPLADGRLSYRGGRLAGLEMEMPLLGLHQWDNAAIALRALEVSPLPLVPHLVRRGIETTQWPGRLERLVVDEVPWLLDGAHNPAGCAALASFLAGRADRPIGLLFGALADKDVPAMLNVLKPFADKLFVARPPSERAMPVGGEGFEDWREAMDAAQAWAKAEGGLVVAAGSLYLVGAIRSTLLPSTTEQRERVHP